jgi:hypothetical protein
MGPFCQPIESKLTIDRFNDPLERSVLSDATVMQPLQHAATTVINADVSDVLVNNTHDVSHVSVHMLVMLVDNTHVSDHERAISKWHMPVADRLVNAHFESNY